LIYHSRQWKAGRQAGMQPGMQADRQAGMRARPVSPNKVRVYLRHLALAGESFAIDPPHTDPAVLVVQPVPASPLDRLEADGEWLLRVWGDKEGKGSCG